MIYMCVPVGVTKEKALTSEKFIFTHLSLNKEVSDFRGAFYARIKLSRKLIKTFRRNNQTGLNRFHNGFLLA